MDFKFFLNELWVLPSLIILMTTLTTGMRYSLKPDKLEKLITMTHGFKGYVFASLIGAVTPFCSCSSVPIFLGLMQTSLKPGFSFSFLITSPLVHEVALVMVWQLFGWKLAVFYLTFSLILGIIGGWLLDVTHASRWIQVHAKSQNFSSPYIADFKKRWLTAFIDSLKLFKKIMPMIFIGILIGSFLHGQNLGILETWLMKSDRIWHVVIAVMIGIPLYSGIAVGIPIAYGLISSGLGLGTGMAFILSVAGLSLPEMVMLKAVMKWPLLVGFISYIATGMVLAGWLMNVLETLLF